MAEKHAASEVELEALPEGRFTEYLKIFEEAMGRGSLGKVIPPKTLTQMKRWGKHGTTFFLIHAESHVIGVCAVSQNRLLKKRFQLRNQYIKPEYQKKGYGKLMIDEQERFAINRGARKLYAFLYYPHKFIKKHKGQYSRFRKAGYVGGHFPSITHALRGRFSGKVTKKVKPGLGSKPPLWKRLLRWRK